MSKKLVFDGAELTENLKFEKLSQRGVWGARALITAITITFCSLRKTVKLQLEKQKHRSREVYLFKIKIRSKKLESHIKGPLELLWI